MLPFLDPRYKFQFVTYCFRTLDPETSDLKSKIVKDQLDLEMATGPGFPAPHRGKIAAPDGDGDGDGDGIQSPSGDGDGDGGQFSRPRPRLPTLLIRKSQYNKFY